MTVVLHLLNDVHRHGNGIVNAAVDLACGQAAVGHDVWVASAGGEFVELLSAHGVGHVELPRGRLVRSVLLTALTVRSHVRSHGVEVLHVHVNFATLIGRLAVIGTDARLVATAHTAFKREATLMALAARVIAVGRSVGDEMVRRGVPPGRVRIVKNGTLGSPRVIESDELAPLLRPAVVSVAGLYRRKGIDLLIDAFVRVAIDLPDAHLYLVGAGPDASRFRAQAAATAVSSRIHFEGYQEDVGRYLRAADLFVLPSRQDPFPLVIIEAREAGCAIVGSTADGIPEALDWGRAGWLFPAGDGAALEEALRILLGSTDERARLRRVAADNLGQFALTRVVADVDAVYEELLER